MRESILYLLTSFWLGAAHAATPGHGKTIAASYIVGMRSRPVDAFVLGIFVTLSHTSGILLVALLATVGSTWLIPQRIEAYLAVVTGLLVIGIGCFMLKTQVRLLTMVPAHDHISSGGKALADDRVTETGHSHECWHDTDHEHNHADHEGHAHSHGAHYHSHGWGLVHSHDLEAIAQARPQLGMLLALGIAGGLLPDPGALAILLAAIGKGKFILGLLTVVVFSLGFASVLVVVGVVAARVGQLILDWLSSRWIGFIQVGAGVLIIGVGVVLTANAWRMLVGVV
jgi:nickel/cobalt exporter